MFATALERVLNHDANPADVILDLSAVSPMGHVRHLFGRILGRFSVPGATSCCQDSGKQCRRSRRLAEGVVLYRVDQNKRLPGQFNPSVLRNTHFCPIKKDHAQVPPVGTIILAQTPNVEDRALHLTVHTDYATVGRYRLAGSGLVFK